MKNEKMAGRTQLSTHLRSEAGEVIANIITVDGVDVEVAEDVYLRLLRRRTAGSGTCVEEQSSGKTALAGADGGGRRCLPDYVGAETAPSAEERRHWSVRRLRNLAEQKQILVAGACCH